MTAHYTTRMAKIKADVTECWGGSEMQKCSHLEDGLAISYKVKCTLSTPSSNSTPNYFHKGKIKYVHAKVRMWVFIETLFIIAPKWKHSHVNHGDW